MPTISRFEDIEAWRSSLRLTRLIYRVTSQHQFQDLPLRDQMRRAAVSVLSNIAEGFERDGNKEFRHFLSVAKGSTGELKAQLYVALYAGFLSQRQFDRLYELATDVARLIAGFMNYLASAEPRGLKFRRDNGHSRPGGPHRSGVENQRQVANQKLETRN